MDYELMKKLSEADGISSNEDEIAKIMVEEFKNPDLRLKLIILEMSLRIK